MRLWPLSILSQLPRQQLLGQHRECCALRGKGWGRKHATVDYVFKHPYAWLYEYHKAVMLEMWKRRFVPSPWWWDIEFRGKGLEYDYSEFTMRKESPCATIYPEHDAAYLAECVENLARKGVKIKELSNERHKA